jgi:hypothetical protein
VALVTGNEPLSNGLYRLIKQRSSAAPDARLAKPNRVALASQCKLDDALSNQLCRRVCPVSKVEVSQRRLEGTSQKLDLVWSERTRAQQPMDRHYAALPLRA